jgi:hypothetical protein
MLAYMRWEEYYYWQDVFQLSPNHKLSVCIDIGNMYLNTKLISPEYMRIHIDLIPEEIQHEYNIKAFADKDGCVLYMEVTGAIYGLSQSRYLANQDLIKNLAIYGYHPVNSFPAIRVFVGIFY